MRVPARGEIWHVDLNPTAGKEQQGARPIFIVSDKEFNRAGLALICPITQGGLSTRFAGFAVPLMNSGTQTQGVVMCNQSRTLDHASRAARFIEKAPGYITDEVIARLRTLLD